MSQGHKLVPVFAIQDVKSSVYGVSIFGGSSLDTDAAGTRNFIGVLKDNYADFRWFNPADYRLFRIGYFDIDSGEPVYEKSELLVDGASLDISEWERSKER